MIDRAALIRALEERRQALSEEHSHEDTYTEPDTVRMGRLEARIHENRRAVAIAERIQSAFSNTEMQSVSQVCAHLSTDFMEYVRAAVLAAAARDLETWDRQAPRLDLRGPDVPADDLRDQHRRQAESRTEARRPLPAQAEEEEEAATRISGGYESPVPNYTPHQPVHSPEPVLSREEYESRRAQELRVQYGGLQTDDQS